MCSQYGFHFNVNKLRSMGIDIGNAQGELEERYLPFSKVPVVVNTSQGLKLTPMTYSLVPSWSKEAKPKFATYNARIETVTEKPAWREPFVKYHCLIPMTHFYESVYEGPHAGHIVSFMQKDQSVMLAAGLFDVWNDPQSKSQSFSCAIITTQPSPFVLENGHDRTPIFLNFEDGQKWLTLKQTPNEMVDFLLSKNIYPDLSVGRDRALKSGWEKKI